MLVTYISMPRVLLMDHVTIVLDMMLKYLINKAILDRTCTIIRLYEFKKLQRR